MLIVCAFLFFFFFFNNIDFTLLSEPSWQKLSYNNFAHLRAEGKLFPLGTFAREQKIKLNNTLDQLNNALDQLNNVLIQGE